jgi:essential nuclear protein 1
MNNLVRFKKNIKVKFNFNESKIKVLKILERTGIILKVYRSGKVPKIVKIIPLFENFEDLIWYTRPDRWSTRALFIVSKIFIKKLNNFETKRFLTLIFLPRLQECIFKKENLNLYIPFISKIANLNPKIFFSSIILPFFTSSRCCKTESVVLSLILLKISFQTKHISWALIKLLKTSQNSPKYIILRTLLAKNYNFSYRILDVLVDFFIKNKKRTKNVFFLKCYIIFLKNYSKFLSLEDKNRLPVIFQNNLL